MSRLCCAHPCLCPSLCVFSVSPSLSLSPFAFIASSRMHENRLCRVCICTCVAILRLSLPFCVRHSWSPLCTARCVCLSLYFSRSARVSLPLVFIAVRCMHRKRLSDAMFYPGQQRTLPPAIVMRPDSEVKIKCVRGMSLVFLEFGCLRESEGRKKKGMWSDRRKPAHRSSKQEQCRK